MSLIGPRRYAFSMGAGSNSGYDDNYLRSCVRYLGFHDSLRTGTETMASWLLHMTTSLFPCTFLIGYKR
jgi:hypothetical protein